MMLFSIIADKSYLRLSINKIIHLYKLNDTKIVRMVKNYLKCFCLEKLEKHKK